MRERHRVAVGRLDRDRLATGRDGSGEADRSGRRRNHGLTGSVGTDVDAAMLPGSVGSRLVVRESSQDRSLHRPTPSLRGRSPGQTNKTREDDAPSDRFQNEQHTDRVSARLRVVKSDYNDRS